MSACVDCELAIYFLSPEMACLIFSKTPSLCGAVEPCTPVGESVEPWWPPAPNFSSGAWLCAPSAPVALLKPCWPTC